MPRHRLFYEGGWGVPFSRYASVFTIRTNVYVYVRSFRDMYYCMFSNVFISQDLPVGGIYYSAGEHFILDVVRLCTDVYIDVHVKDVIQIKIRVNKRETNCADSFSSEDLLVGGMYYSAGRHFILNVDVSCCKTACLFQLWTVSIKSGPRKEQR